MLKRILHELERHAPFTLFGAMTGIIVMIIFWNLPYKGDRAAFYVLHPAHVFLSALVTSSMYRNYKCAADRKNCNIFALLGIGLVGAVGVATLSDSLMPYLGELLLRMPHAEPHIGFIEHPILILSLAIAGIIVAYYRPQTRFPHAGHVLISTWASLFHILMAKGPTFSILSYIAVFVFLFLAVWLPCCISDIIFPLLFVGKDRASEIKSTCCH